MIAYSIQTYEGCTITCDVEGHHVAAGLDELLQAKQGAWQAGPTGSGTKSGLLVPYLVDALLVRLITMKAIAIVQAAGRAGCMPGMIMAALVRIKARAHFWHQKALRYEAAELRRNAASQKDTNKGEHHDTGRAHGDIDQESTCRPTGDESPTTAATVTNGEGSAHVLEVKVDETKPKRTTKAKQATGKRRKAKSS